MSMGPRAFPKQLWDWDNRMTNNDGIKIKFLWFDIITPSTGLNNNIEHLFKSL